MAVMKRTMIALALSALPLMSFAQTSEGYNDRQEYYDAHTSPFWVLSKDITRYIGFINGQSHLAAYVTPNIDLPIGAEFQAGWKLIDGDPAVVWAQGDPPVFANTYTVTPFFHHWVGWFLKGSYDANNLPPENVPVFYNSVVPVLYDKVSEDEF